MSADEYFDYKTVKEEDEGLDFDNRVPCPHCKKLIPYNATMCYYCGAEVNFRKRPRWIFLTTVLLIIIFIAFIFLVR